ncbi:MAG: nucleotidyltransferase family protein, partial [Geminicoccaceae bacterium]
MVDPPALPPQDWRPVIAAADRHLVLPALAASAKDLGIAEALPPVVGELLGHVRAANARRNRALFAALEDTTIALNGAGIEPILLKGAARLVDGLYPDPGWRLMADLDLLVPAEAAEAAWASLVGRGYAVVGGDRPGSRHLAGLLHPATSAMIEVHRDLTTEHLRRIPRLETIGERASPIAIGSGRARLPALADQLVHLAVHEQLQHPRMIGGAFSLRGVLEARLLMQRLGARDAVALDMEMPGGLPRRAMRLMRAQTATLFDWEPIPHGDPIDRWLLRRTLRGGIEPPARRIHRGIAMAQLLALTRCAEA